MAASIVYQGYSPVRFAHDLPVELLVELGVGGLVLALGLYVAGAQALWRARNCGEMWLLGPAVAAFLGGEPDRLAMAPGGLGCRMGTSARRAAQAGGYVSDQRT